jgi:copper chaperone
MGILTDMATATFTVKGMTCGHCVAAVSDEVRRVPGVRGVDVDLASGSLHVESDEPVAPAAIVAAVEEAGYEVVA